jgi:hypothetical protein
MKKYFKKLGIALCILSLVFLTFNGFTQEEQTSSGFSLNYGIKGGVNFHEFTDQPPHMGGKMGLSLGVFGLYEFTDLIALQMELGYFQQGGTYVQFIDDTRFDVPESFFSKNVKDASVTLHNIYVPLQATITMFPQTYMPRFLIGPYMDVTFAAKESYQKTGEIEDNIYVTTMGSAVVTDQYEMFQFGVVAGIEFVIPTDKDWNMLFGVSYKYGLTPVKKSYSYIDYFTVTEDFNTNALLITLGIQF